jgi:hypothetical protein
LVINFHENVQEPGTGRNFFKLKLYLHPATNFLHFGSEQQGPLQAYTLQRNQPGGWSANFTPGFSVRRGEFVDLEYGRGTNHRILFPACELGRKLFIDGEVFVVESITRTDVILGKDPGLTPMSDPSRNRKYPLPIPIPGAAPVLAGPGE